MIFRFSILMVIGSVGVNHSLCARDADETSTLPVSVSWSASITSPGVCIDREGWFISVVPDSIAIDSVPSPKLNVEGTEIEARILFIDAAQRLCLLEASSGIAGISPFPLSQIVQPKGGQKLECLSNRSACLTMVAGKDWSYRGEQFPMPLLRVRVADPDEFCSSGTPLVCEKGHLVGILTGQTLGGQGEVHAIPASRIRKLVEDVKRYQKSGPVWIGLVFHNQSSTPEVIEVKPGSPAEDGGMKAGDVILSLNGAGLETLEDLVEAIYDLPAGEEAEVTVLRGLSEESLLIIPQFAEMTAAAR